MENSILEALCASDVAAVERLLDEGGEANTAIEDGNTLLHLAAGRGDSASGYALINANALVDARNGQGETPLILAVKHGWDDFVRLLIENGAALDIWDNSGNTAIFYAKERGFTDIAERLQIAGAAYPS